MPDRKYLLPLLLVSLFVVGGFVLFKVVDKINNAFERSAYRKMQVQLAKKMQPGDFTYGELQVPYRLFVPKSDTETEHPLILVLHSGRGRGDDNINQMDQTIQMLTGDLLQTLEPVYVLAPQVKKWTHWVDYPKFTPPFENFDQREIPQSENLKAALALLDEVIQTHAVDSSRVYITGISMGGEGTWDALTYRPDLFAAALPLNGAGDPRAINRVGKLPIRFFHGSEDRITPVANSRELHLAFTAFDNNARYFELEGRAHDIREQVYTRDNLLWLLSHRKGS